MSSSSIIAFGKFRLDRRRRQLFVENTLLPLHARALDVLEFLIDHRDSVVSRDEVVANVWRGRIVGENNLSVQLSAVRRQLGAHGGADLIVTVVGRGYRFAGDVSEPQTRTGHDFWFAAPSGELPILCHRPFPRRKPHFAAFPAAVDRLASARGHARNAADIESS
jgi:DNA-binding winged helix-turn-helix (wHTH) protein